MKSIKISKNAQQGVRKIALYIEKNFGPETRERYLNDLEKQFLSISVNSRKYASIEYKGLLLKRCIFEKRTIILFEDGNNWVEILDVLDARTHWKKE